MVKVGSETMQSNIMSQDYESLRAQLHEARLINAEQRAKITQLNREKLELESSLQRSTSMMERFKDEYVNQK